MPAYAGGCDTCGSLSAAFVEGGSPSPLVSQKPISVVD